MIEIGKAKNYIITAVFIAITFAVLEPFVAYLLYKRAGDYMTATLVKDAARTYRKTLFLNPEDLDSRNWLAYCNHLMGKKDKAVSEYKKAIDLDPDDVVALFDLANIYYKEEGKVEAAKELFVKASNAPKSANITESNHHFYTRSARRMLEIIERKARESAGSR